MENIGGNSDGRWELFGHTVEYKEDIKIGGYTVWFEKYPHIISEGENKEDALKNLGYAMFVVFNHIKEEVWMN